MPATRLGAMFRPDTPVRHVLLATIPCGDGTVRMLGVNRDGYVTATIPHPALPLCRGGWVGR
jgi:hypothetical protein